MLAMEIISSRKSMYLQRSTKYIPTPLGSASGGEYEGKKYGLCTSGGMEGGIILQSEERGMWFQPILP
jgi:hypothetical protein